jgi:hypothetical protein
MVEKASKCRITSNHYLSLSLCCRYFIFDTLNPKAQLDLTSLKSLTFLQTNRTSIRICSWRDSQPHGENERSRIVEEIGEILSLMGKFSGSNRLVAKIFDEQIDVFHAVKCLVRIIFLLGALRAK